MSCCFNGNRHSSSSALLVLEVLDGEGEFFWRDCVVRVVRKARDWRICFGFEEVCREWRRSVRFWWRSDSERMEESRREEEAGDNSAARAFVRDCNR